MERIVLIGYMGSGKSTIGYELSQILNIPFYDLDKYIEYRVGKSISQIFFDIGERGFREIEYACLHEIVGAGDYILSCGGGTPCFFDNMEYINKHAETIYLKCPIDVLCHRLKNEKFNRPLLKDLSIEEMESFITPQLKERELFYQKSKHMINISPMDNVKSTVNKVYNLLK